MRDRQISQSDDHVQRRTELVANLGDKGRFGALGVLGHPPHGRQVLVCQTKLSVGMSKIVQRLVQFGSPLARLVQQRLRPLELVPGPQRRPLGRRLQPVDHPNRAPDADRGYHHAGLRPAPGINLSPQKRRDRPHDGHHDAGAQRECDHRNAYHEPPQVKEPRPGKEHPSQRQERGRHHHTGPSSHAVTPLAQPKQSHCSQQGGDDDQAHSPPVASGIEQQRHTQSSQDKASADYADRMIHRLAVTRQLGALLEFILRDRHKPSLPMALPESVVRPWPYYTQPGPAAGRYLTIALHRPPVASAYLWHPLPLDRLASREKKEPHACTMDAPSHSTAHHGRL